MKRKILILVTILMIMSIPSYAINQDATVGTGSQIRYTSVERIRAELVKSGSSATCYIGATPKSKLDSISATLKLMDASGKTISTKTGTFTKNGSIFTLSKTFKLSKSGTYRVKFTLKTYRGGALQETISGQTNTVKK